MKIKSGKLQKFVLLPNMDKILNGMTKENKGSFIKDYISLCQSSPKIEKENGKKIIYNFQIMIDIEKVL